MIHDFIWRQERVIDGGGRPAFEADVAVKDGRISRIGSLEGAAGEREFDLKGLCLTPGFIDSHSHADLALLEPSLEHEKLRMGVTAEVIGQCGFSAFPISDAHRLARKKSMAGFLPGRDLSWTWNDLDGYRRAALSGGLTHNVVPLAGHGSVRLAVMGDRPDRPTPAELDRMRRLTDEAMAQGAFGLSSGLIYAPACYAETDEVLALAQVAAARGGHYVTHVRGETAALIDRAVDEAVYIAETAGAPLQVSHLKVIGLGGENAGRIQAVLGRIDAARARGLRVHFDCYPYTEGSTMLNALLPRWAHEGGEAGLLKVLSSPEGRFKVRRTIENDSESWENWLKACGYAAVKIGALPGGRMAPIVGRDLADIAAERGADPLDALCDVLIREGAGIIMVFSMMREEDMKAALAHPAGMIGTDAIPCPPGQGRPHPRGYGAFPRILGRYARDEGLFSLEEAVRKMTSLPAAKWGLEDRGLAAEDQIADLVVFDPDAIIDRATYEDPRQTPEGVVHVMVAGRLALESGRPTGELAGTFLEPNFSR